MDLFVIDTCPDDAVLSDSDNEAASNKNLTVIESHSEDDDGDYGGYFPPFYLYTLERYSNYVFFSH